MLLLECYARKANVSFDFKALLLLLLPIQPNKPSEIYNDQNRARLRSAVGGDARVLQRISWT